MNDPINIRASSVAPIIDCPKRGLSLALGLVKQLPSTPPSIIGTACHEATAVFDKNKVEGHPIMPDDAAEVIVENIQNPRDEVNWGKVTKKDAERRALGVYTRYCSDIAPTIEYDEVELTLAPLVIDVDGLDIELTGTLDRVYSAISFANTSTGQFIDMWPSKGRGILDIKTGARVCSTKPGKHKGQIGVYEILAEQTLGKRINLPGLIGQLQTSTDYQVDVKPVENARAALLGDDYNIGLIQHIGHMLKTGDFYGNSSSWLCSDKYCPLYDGCIFR